MLSKHDERWRERERLRQVKRKAAAKEPAPPQPTESDKLDFPKLHDFGGRLTELKFETVTIGGYAAPPIDERLAAVSKALDEITLSLRDLRFHTALGMPSFIPYEKTYVCVSVSVKPTPLTGGLHTQEILLRGGGKYVDTAEEAVREARRLMIELVAHEIDEWLYVAGLGPNPHLWPDGVVPPGRVGKLDERFSK